MSWTRRELDTNRNVPYFSRARRERIKFASVAKWRDEKLASARKSGRVISEERPPETTQPGFPNQASGPGNLAALEETIEAHRYMESNQQIGKIVVTV